MRQKKGSLIERFLPKEKFGRMLVDAWLADFRTHAEDCTPCYAAVQKALAEDDLTGRVVAANVCSEGAYWMRCLGLLKDAPDQLVISAA